MILSSDEAAAALRAIVTARARSSRVYGYQRASTNLILWGVLWAVGYSLTDAMPHRALSIWGVLVAIGVASSVAIGVRNPPRRASAGEFAAESVRTAADPSPRWRPAATLLIAFAFIVSSLAVMWPVSGRQIGAFVPLVVAALYALAGTRLGWRFIVTGGAIASLTLIGFFLVPAHFALWMAGVGGGALILAGLWLRTV